MKYSNSLDYVTYMSANISLHNNFTLCHSFSFSHYINVRLHIPINVSLAVHTRTLNQDARNFHNKNAFLTTYKRKKVSL